MITRNGTTLTVTFPDEEGARAIEWLLNRLLGSATSVAMTGHLTPKDLEEFSIQPGKVQVLQHRLPSSEELAGLERQRQREQMSRKSAADLVSRNREGLMPFRTERPNREDL